VAEYSKRTRKCPQCGQWSEWTGNAADLCPYCGSILDEKGFIRQVEKEEREAEEKKKFNITFIEIYPDDYKLVVFFKREVQGFQIAFVAILSFILWLIALLAG
jgi:endogenous inhibitor of DNA gyrase (YacG/DUF329 family)